MKNALWQLNSGFQCFSPHYKIMYNFDTNEKKITFHPFWCKPFICYISWFFLHVSLYEFLFGNKVQHDIERKLLSWLYEMITNLPQVCQPSPPCEQCNFFFIIWLSFLQWKKKNCWRLSLNYLLQISSKVSNQWLNGNNKDNDQPFL